MLRPALFDNRSYKPMFFDDSFDKMVDDAFRDFWGGSELERHDAFRTDVIDQGDKYLLQAELPGFRKEDINIDLKNDLLTISASHKEEKDEEDQNKYIRKERCCRSYSRSFRVSNMEAGDNVQTLHRRTRSAFAQIIKLRGKYYSVIISRYINF